MFVMKLLYTVYCSIYKSVGRFLSLNSEDSVHEVNM